MRLTTAMTSSDAVGRARVASSQVICTMERKTAALAIIPTTITANISAKGRQKWAPSLGPREVAVGATVARLGGRGSAERRHERLDRGVAPAEGASPRMTGR